MTLLFQTIITGLAIGGIYSLMAVGYSLVFSILNFSNFAYGGIIMLGSFAGYYAMTLMGANIIVALAVSMLLMAALCLATERVAYSPLRKRHAPPMFFMISAMGLSIFLENMVYATIGAHFYAYPINFESTTINVFGAALGKMDLFAIVFSVIAIAILNYFISKTRLGMAIRAASYDSTVATLNGVNLGFVIGIVFVIAGAFAGISGMFLGMKYMAYPNMGWITNKAYIAAVIGGLGSLPGAIWGGIILGVIEALVSVYLTSTFRDVFSFALLIIILLVKPAGLLGKYLEEKV